MSRRSLVVAIGVVALSAFIGAIALYGYYGRAASPEPAAADPRGLVRAHSPVLGPRDARVTIVEFFDPACEACRAMHPVVKQILASFPNDVRLVLRYAPFHRGSQEAVRVLEAARMQGRFEPVLEALLARQPEWASHSAPNPLRTWEIAASVGVDMSRGRIDGGSPDIGRVLEQDMADVRANMVQGTPTFFVNGRPLESLGSQQLFSLVRDEVTRAGGTTRTP